MKACTHCFRYSTGQPSYCTHCGRSYNVRICARGHVNPRGVTFCSQCGTEDLSTPAPPAGFLFYVSQWTLQLMLGAFVGLVVLSVIAAVVYSIDWSVIGPRLTGLLLMLAFLYWTATL